MLGRQWNFVARGMLEFRSSMNSYGRKRIGVLGALVFVIESWWTPSRASLQLGKSVALRVSHTEYRSFRGFEAF